METDFRSRSNLFLTIDGAFSTGVYCMKADACAIAKKLKTISRKEGVTLFVDMFSGQYLNGITINYTSNMMGSGFTFDNPNATGGCGCGESFSA